MPTEIDVSVRPLGVAHTSETSLDDDAKYYFDWEATDWGFAGQPEPEGEQSVEGAVVYKALDQSWMRRQIRLAGYVEVASHNAKIRAMSDLAKLLQGEKTIRLKAWEIDVTGLAPTERDETKEVPQVLGYECVMYATPPFWRLMTDFDSIIYGAFLYADMGIPFGEAQPPYLFGRDLSGAQAIAANPGSGSHFTIDNWGTAFCYPTASISNGPVSTTLYLKGAGRTRLKLTTNGSGGVTFTPADRFYLAPGSQGIRFEDAAGAALNLTAQTTMRINFGSTIPRFR